MTSVSRDDFDIITVVLGADSKKIRTSDSIKLIEYTYKNYELLDLQELLEEDFEDWRKINEGRIKIYKGVEQNVRTALGELKYTKFPIEKNNIDNIWTEVKFKDYFEAPVEKNTKVGEIETYLNTTEIMSTEIFTREKIERKGVKDYFEELIKRYLKIYLT